MKDSARPDSLELFIGGMGAEPAKFRDAVILSENLGFEVAWIGDHFVPWTHTTQNAGFAWSIIAACLQATRKIRVGPLVTAVIGARYHPAMVAHAVGTLDNMYPGRVVLAVGTGEAENELPFLGRWPPWSERMGRLCEGVKLMRKLWTSNEYFDFPGKYFRMDGAFLFTKPKSPIEIVFAAYGPLAALKAGEYGDGFVTETVRVPFELLRDELLPAFDAGAKKVGKDPHKAKKAVSLDFTMKDKDAYLKQVRPTAGMFAKGVLDEPDPRRITEMSSTLSDENLLSRTNFCSSWDDVIELVERYRRIGINRIIIRTGPNPKVIRDYAKHLLPYFQRNLKK